MVSFGSLRTETVVVVVQDKGEVFSPAIVPFPFTTP